MRTKIVEATSSDGLHLKAAVSIFDKAEWDRPSIVISQYSKNTKPLLKDQGWTEHHFMIQDLSPPGAGAIFCMGGVAEPDMHRAPAIF